MQQVLQVLKEHAIDTETVLKGKETLILQKRPQVEKVKETKSNYVNGVVGRIATVEKFKQAQRKIHQQKILGARLFIESAEGYSFPHFGQIDHFLDEGKSQLKHESGEVLLVSIWASWSKASPKIMQKIQQMLDSNRDAWNGRVRVVAVNADEKHEEAVNMFNEYKWTSMQHLTINGWDKTDKLLENFSVQGLPFVILVNKFGKVDFEGGPNHIYLESRICELLLQQQEEEYQKPPIETTNFSTIFEETERGLRSLLTVEKVSTIFSESDLFCSKLTIQSIVAKGITYKQFLLQAWIYEGDINGLNKISEHFQTIEGVEVKLTQVKCIDVPNVTEPACWNCKAALTFPYYWLRWEEETLFGCINCVHQTSNQPKHHYAYEKNSILLTGNWNKIPLKGLGNNLQPQNITEFSKTHQFACNACDKCSPLGEARYICLGCRADPNFNYDYVDLCQACIGRVGEDSEEMNKCFEREMHCSSHPWLRVLYQAGSYQRY